MRVWMMIGLSSMVAWGCSDSVTTQSGGSGGGGVGGDPACNCALGASTPVCGVDGQTYDATCGEQCVPVAIECQGECPCADCAGFETAYAAALADAKSCTPQLSVEQCTEYVDDELACPCIGAFVNPMSSAATAELQQLKQDWDSNACGALVDCPGIGCVTPTQGFCVPDASGMSGSCDIAP